MNQTYKIDLLNIFLMVISFVLAIIIPFKLFLFSYAFLGPLHYLTEINWLNQKNFFLEKKKRFVGIAISFGLFLTLMNSIGLYKMEVSMFSAWTESSLYQKLVPWTTNFIFILFLFSLIIIFVKKEKWALFSIPLLAILSLYFVEKQSYVILFGVFIPTIIHVYFFTAFFILYGALKSKSTWGIVSFFVLMSVMLFFSYDFKFTWFQYDADITKAYMASNFHVVNYHIANLFNTYDNTHPFVLADQLGLKIQAFIAFAYTYHYLNWFTKTSTIQWHRMNTRNAIIIGIVWIISVALYYIDYKLGVILLLYLSFLHVFLEFPLNFVSIKGIVTQLRER